MSHNIKALRFSGTGDNIEIGTFIVPGGKQQNMSYCVALVL
jgi:hypothetical protein